MEKLLVLLKQFEALARGELQEMLLLAESRLYRGAISRAYYACLHAMQYLLAQKDIETKSHRQTHIEFRKHFVREGPFGKAESGLVDKLFKLRQHADYDPEYDIDEKGCLELFERTEQFVHTVLGDKH